MESGDTSVPLETINDGGSQVDVGETGASLGDNKNTDSVKDDVVSSSSKHAMGQDAVSASKIIESPNEKLRVLVCTGGAWEVVNGVLEYMPSESFKRILKLPLNLTYSGLALLVATKLNINPQTGFKMCFKFLSSSSFQTNTDVIEIVDNDDVEELLEYVVNMFKNGVRVTLYVSEYAFSGGNRSGTRSNQPRSVAPAAPTPTMSQPRNYNQPTQQIRARQIPVQTPQDYNMTGYQHAPGYQHVPSYQHFPPHAPGNQHLPAPQRVNPYPQFAQNFNNQHDPVPQHVPPYQNSPQPVPRYQHLPPHIPGYQHSPQHVPRYPNKYQVEGPFTNPRVPRYPNRMFGMPLSDSESDDTDTDESDENEFDDEEEDGEEEDDDDVELENEEVDVNMETSLCMGLSDNDTSDEHELDGEEEDDGVKLENLKIADVKAESPEDMLKTANASNSSSSEQEGGSEISLQ